jgi:hypothetical protein
MAGEGPEMRLARESGEESIDDETIHLDNRGIPLIHISCAAAELIPTRQYANVTVGPVVIKRWIPIDFKGFSEDELNSMKLAVKEIQSICEEAVADERQTVHALTRQSEQGRYQS